ncbi:MAG: 3-methylornithyl-N6-L-lysine dehydrogenase PylD [Desulfobacterales bacterium]
MTRLQLDDISNISSRLVAYDEELLVKTGHNLRQIACHATELKEEAGWAVISRLRVGVVPIRWGQGVIEGFCEATAGILRHLGFDTFVTRQADIMGLTEAYEIKADAVFLSDDNDFVALNTHTRQYVHNAAATGKGFVAGLDLMARGLAGKKVLVLGCGSVGRSATATLLSYGAKPSIYDINSEYSRELLKSLAGPDLDRITIELNFRAALAGHTLIVDATNAAEIIHAVDISPHTFIAAPGMPLGLSRGALNKVSDRLLHDPLQTGVATMGMALVKQIMQIG